MADAVEQEKPQKSAKRNKKPSWLWPIGVATTGLAGMAVLMFRGCWHRRMSWPVRMQNYSYQVCLGCGVKRLFDEKRFCAYGPFRYDLNELIAWEVSKRTDSAAVARAQRPAS